MMKILFEDFESDKNQQRFAEKIIERIGNYLDKYEFDVEFHNDLYSVDISKTLLGLGIMNKVKRLFLIFSPKISDTYGAQIAQVPLDVGIKKHNYQIYLHIPRTKRFTNILHNKTIGLEERISEIWHEFLNYYGFSLVHELTHMLDFIRRKSPYNGDNFTRFVEKGDFNVKDPFNDEKYLRVYRDDEMEINAYFIEGIHRLEKQIEKNDIQIDSFNQFWNMFQENDENIKWMSPKNLQKYKKRLYQHYLNHIKNTSE